MNNKNLTIFTNDNLENNINVGLNTYLDMDEDERAIAFFTERKLNKKLNGELGKAKDGNNKYLSTTEIVKILNIDKLTSTLFNKWLCHQDFGEMKKIKGQKKRYFHPNNNFEDKIAKLGYATTGKTVLKDKPKVSYRPSILDVLNKEDTRKSIVDFIRKEVG